MKPVPCFGVVVSGVSTTMDGVTIRDPIALHPPPQPAIQGASKVTDLVPLRSGPNEKQKKQKCDFSHDFYIFL